MILPIICQFCQEERYHCMFNRTGNKKYKNCCYHCFESIFEFKNFSHITQNGMVQVVWRSEVDDIGNEFRIYFHYDEKKTVFTRQKNREKVVLTINKTMPITEFFLKKARLNLRKWQIFS